MKNLVYVQDPYLAVALTDILKEEGYETTIIKNFEDSNSKEIENNYVCSILELSEQHQTNLSLIQKFRANHTRIPLLILVPNNLSKEHLNSYFDAGADDFIKKPINFDELIIRLKLLLRPKTQKLPAKICVGNLLINPARKEAFYKGELLQLTTKEYALLEYFAKNPGIVLSRSQISENVWDMDFEQNSNVVDVYVGYLRAKLDKKFGVDLIKTVRGHGYMFEVPEASDTQQSSSKETSNITVSTTEVSL